MNFTFVLPRIEFAQSEQLYGKVIAPQNIENINVYFLCYLHRYLNVYSEPGRRNYFMKKIIVPIFGIKTEAVKIPTGNPWAEFQFSLPIPLDTPVNLFKNPVDLTFSNDAINISNLLIAHDPRTNYKEVIPIEIIPLVKPEKCVDITLQDDKNDIKISLNRDTCHPFGTFFIDVVVNRIQDKTGLKISPAILIKDISPSALGLTHVTLNDEINIQKLNSGDHFKISVNCVNYTRFCQIILQNFAQIEGGMYFNLYTGPIKRKINGGFIPMQIGIKNTEELTQYIRTPRKIDLSNLKGKLQFEIGLIPYFTKIQSLNAQELIDLQQNILKEDLPKLFGIIYNPKNYRSLVCRIFKRRFMGFHELG